MGRIRRVSSQWHCSTHADRRQIFSIRTKDRLLQLGLKDPHCIKTALANWYTRAVLSTERYSVCLWLTACPGAETTACACLHTLCTRSTCGSLSNKKFGRTLFGKQCLQTDAKLMLRSTKKTWSLLTYELASWKAHLRRVNFLCKCSPNCNGFN